MKFELKHVWQAFLSWMIDKFNYRKPDDPILSMLRLELEYAHIEKELLVRTITELTKPKTEVEARSDINDFKPVGRESWQAKAQRLSRESFERRRQMEAEYKASQEVNNPNPQTVDELEAELAIGESNA